MKPNTNSGSSASPNEIENPFENVKKLSDIFEVETDFDFDVFFEETDDLLPSLVWYPEMKLSDHCREVYAAVLECPVRIDDDHLIISVESEKENLILELLSVLSGDCSSSIYDRMVISQ
jgi:hypothetical protein